MHALVLAAALLVQQAEPVSETGAPVDEPAPVSAIALDLLERLPPSIEDWSPEGTEGAAAMQAFAMVGREDLVARFDAAAFTYQPCPVLEGDALEAVIEAARAAQIVIINEAHDQPFHRHVIAQLGLALSDDFEVFAAETFNYVRLMEPREPGPLGWYDREPVFARQIAALDEAGYRFVAYEIRAPQRDPEAESREARIAVREEAQADNLIAEVLADDPDARILVHVGYSHVLEAPQPQPGMGSDGEDAEPLVWFAARLKAKTGIDPLTISQTHCSPAAAAPLGEGEGADGGVDDTPEGEGPADPVPAIGPGELVLADGSGAAPAGAVDLFLAHGPITFTDHRPDWRRAAGDGAVAIPEALLPENGPVIVEARAPEATLEHLPIDRVLVYPGEAPVLLLPQGEWVVTAWNGGGQVGDAVTVTAG
ncbi:MAG: hypothetical protein NXI12_13365 [Alphaproteobacteria bacterium]|nr:hypothetical protein [Alphaproteobacteria bacterium]